MKEGLLIALVIDEPDSLAVEVKHGRPYCGHPAARDDDVRHVTAQLRGNDSVRYVRAIARGLGQQPNGHHRVADFHVDLFKLDWLPRALIPGLDEADVRPFIAPLKYRVKLFVILIKLRDDDLELGQLRIGNARRNDRQRQHYKPIVGNDDSGANEIDLAEF